MKTKTYSVVYNTTTQYEAIIGAENSSQAVERVKDVVGEDIEVVDTWEIKNDKIRTIRKIK